MTLAAKYAKCEKCGDVLCLWLQKKWGWSQKLPRNKPSLGFMAGTVHLQPWPPGSIHPCGGQKARLGNPERQFKASTAVISGVWYRYSQVASYGSIKITGFCTLSPHYRSTGWHPNWFALVPRSHLASRELRHLVVTVSSCQQQNLNCHIFPTNNDKIEPKKIFKKKQPTILSFQPLTYCLGRSYIFYFSWILQVLMKPKLIICCSSRPCCQQRLIILSHYLEPLAAPSTHCRCNGRFSMVFIWVCLDVFH